MEKYYDEDNDAMYDSEEDYLDTLKKDDHYHFSIPFEYIKKKHGDRDYDIAVAHMEVDVDWSDFNHGYELSYHCPDAYLIDPNEGNGDIEDFWEIDVRPIVEDELDSLGIGSSAICI